MKLFYFSLILTDNFTSSVSAFQVDSFNFKAGDSLHITAPQSQEIAKGSYEVKASDWILSESFNTMYYKLGLR